MIGIIDYGSSNIASICNALQYLDEEYFLINDGKNIKDFKRLILPGVGSFKSAMKRPAYLLADFLFMNNNQSIRL